MNLSKRIKQFFTADKPNPGRRNYKSAKIDRLTADWKPIEITSNQVVYQSLGILRSRSRTCVRNNDYAKRFLQLVDQNVVGSSGIKLVPQVTRSTTGDPDVAANASILRAWKEWSRPVNCDSSGKTSYRSLQQLIVRTMVVDGEAIIKINLDPMASPYGFSLQMIDADLLDRMMNVDLENGNIIRMGVELNSYGRAVAYHFIDRSGYDTKGTGASLRQAQKHVRISADQIIHLFVQEFPNQIRGIPWFATSMLQMHNLDGYQDAATINARIGASKMGFFTNKTGEEYQGEEDSVGNLNMDVSPGAFEELPPGWEFTSFDPAYPTDQYEGFVKATLRGISAGLGISYYAIASDLESVNFSSARIGGAEDQEFYKNLQSFINEHFNTRVYEEWLFYSLIAGKITSDRGRPLPFTLYGKMLSVVWRGRRWQYLEPYKEMSANEKAINLRLKSRSQIIRDMGYEPEEVFAEIEHEYEMFGPFDAPPTDAVTTDVTPNDPENSDGGDRIVHVKSNTSINNDIPLLSDLDAELQKELLEDEQENED